MFSGCCGIIAKDNAVTHSLTHIAKLSDVRASSFHHNSDAKKREQKAPSKGKNNNDAMSMVSGKTSGSKYGKKIPCNLCHK
jgi:hypothetical protein